MKLASRSERKNQPRKLVEEEKKEPGERSRSGRRAKWSSRLSKLRTGVEAPHWNTVCLFLSSFVLVAPTHDVGKQKPKAILNKNKKKRRSVPKRIFSENSVQFKVKWNQIYDTVAVNKLTEPQMQSSSQPPKASGSSLILTRSLPSTESDWNMQKRRMDAGELEMGFPMNLMNTT